ncbi:uncharacterized protein EI97DRAFT_439224 [Westerdykella ornata]|uniref:Uncharacterized protein n=1 Tax=Westerdykella ornata TaxID=318751 RepID=A0A6A6JUA9_WESOR|nr:uncharacterized protein EI97DRAFT_439224 [Westerdykella ornata]KAF2280162.1 hypothetical protein EI97DRAFT_439224 [Westerdykella ornata]
MLAPGKARTNAGLTLWSVAKIREVRDMVPGWLCVSAWHWRGDRGGWCQGHGGYWPVQAHSFDNAQGHRQRDQDFIKRAIHGSHQTSATARTLTDAVSAAARVAEDSTRDVAAATPWPAPTHFPFVAQLSPPSYLYRVHMCRTVFLFPGPAKTSKPMIAPCRRRKSLFEHGGRCSHRPLAGDRRGRPSAVSQSLLWWLARIDAQRPHDGMDVKRNDGTMGRGAQAGRSPLRLMRGEGEIAAASRSQDGRATRAGGCRPARTLSALSILTRQRCAASESLREIVTLCASSLVVAVTFDDPLLYSVFAVRPPPAGWPPASSQPACYKQQSSRSRLFPARAVLLAVGIARRAARQRPARSVAESPESRPLRSLWKAPALPL